MAHANTNLDIPMITLDVFASTQLQGVRRKADMDGLNRVFATAIVNRKFCEALLHEPEQALADGYLGQPFSLTDQEKSLITSIRAESLSDLAKQVNQALDFR